MPDNNQNQQLTEGDRIGKELRSCVNCDSEKLNITSTNQHSMGELWREVTCETCDAAYIETFTIVDTEIIDLPEYDS